jgi:transposase
MRALMDGDRIDELDALREKVSLAHVAESLRAERDAALAARDQLAARCDDLSERVQYLLRQLFGRKSEKQSLHPLLPFADADAPEPPPPPHVEEAPDDETSVPAKRSRPRRVRRLRSDVPRVRVELPLDEADRGCRECGNAMQPFGEDVTERFDFQPARVFVREYVRPKYACPCCQSGVKIAALPPAVIEKGVAEPGLLAQVVVAKFADHLPLHRQQQIFARHGIDLATSTMGDWIRDCTFLLKPIVAELRREVRSSHVIHSDDTKITILDPKKPGGSYSGYLWVYVGDRGDVVYDATESRSRHGPVDFLAGYQGNLQADAYSGYDAIFATGMVIEVACWAHVRRKFVDAAKAGSEVGARVLQLIQALYGVEREASDAGLDDEQRRALRQEKSKPLLALAEPWLREEARRAIPKSILGRAFRYCLKLWPALLRYLDDGRLAIDNNKAEREMRRVAVGRKNWEFAGSFEGAKRAATLYSLIATCRMHDVEPWSYLKDVLGRIATHPASRIAELTPRGWKAAKPSIEVVPAIAD